MGEVGGVGLGENGCWMGGCDFVWVVTSFLVVNDRRWDDRR